MKKINFILIVKSALLMAFLLGLIIFLLFFENIKRLKKAELEYQKSSSDYNVILITIGLLRSDHLHYYGYYRQTSPAIDELAKESFVFQNAFSQSNLTLQSMMSIFTSLYPKSHGVMDVWKDALDSNVKTMAEILGSYGYKTAWFTLQDDPHLHINAGFGRGFADTPMLSRTLDEKEEIFSWIEKNRDNRFFMTINPRILHTPYLPPIKYKDRFKKGKKRNIAETLEEFQEDYYLKIIEWNGSPGSRFYNFIDKKTISANQKIFDGKFTVEKLNAIRDLVPLEGKYKLDQIDSETFVSQIDLNDKNNIDYLVSLYDACILGVDQELVKPLIGKLKSLGLYERCIVIITADHGEEFGEHGLWGHGGNFSDAAIHVPLIMRIPYFKNPGKIKTLVQTIDIMPTIFELLGVKNPYYIQGESLVPLLLKRGKRPVHKYIYGQSNTQAYLRSEKWKLIFNNQNISYELYNVKKDPAELRNVSLKNKKVYAELKNKLNGFTASLPKYKEKEDSFLPFIDKNTREKIKKTGYW